MSLEHVPLTVANFADGKLAEEVNEKLHWILERFRQAEDGEIDLANDKATISVKLHIERSPKAGGFTCSFEEPSVKLPAKVTSGTLAIERDGRLVVAVETDGKQLRLSDTKKSGSDN